MSKPEAYQSSTASRFRDLSRKYFIVLLGFLIVTGLLLIFAAYALPDEGSLSIIRLALKDIGMSIVIASTVGIGFSQFFKLISDNTLTDFPEITEAGVTGFYSTRKGKRATDDLRNKIKSAENGTIQLMSSTLRVFFVPEQAFTDAINEVIRNKPKVKFQVLILDPNSSEAFRRSEAETIGKFASFEDYQNRSMQFKDAEYTRHSIEEINKNFLNKKCEKNNRSKKCETREEWKKNPELLSGKSEFYKPIELRYYNMAPYCFLVIFKDECYVTQNIYWNSSYQKSGSDLPLIRFKKD